VPSTRRAFRPRELGEQAAASVVAATKDRAAALAARRRVLFGIMLGSIRSIVPGHTGADHPNRRGGVTPAQGGASYNPPSFPRHSRRVPASHTANDQPSACLDCLLRAVRPDSRPGPAPGCQPGESGHGRSPAGQASAAGSAAGSFAHPRRPGAAARHLRADLGCAGKHRHHREVPQAATRSANVSSETKWPRTISVLNWHPAPD
jgi:hypothetical protein